jgi:hypothetical protein
MPPSLQPTDDPTNSTTPSPSDPPVSFDDTLYTSFCGPSYLEASAYCNIDSYCPRYVHNS